MKSRKQFYQKVDLRSRGEMIDFLCDHERYSTMNSWNQSTSWANNVKVYNVIPDELQDKVFEMMESEDFYDDINNVIAEYNRKNDYQIQAGFNGRSGGYLVMYEGYAETKTIFTFTDEKSLKSYNGREYADGFGWRDIEEAKAQGLYNKKIRKIGVWPGRSVDNYDCEDYEDKDQFSMSSLKEIVQKVQRFDQLCDDVVRATIELAENCEVEEEEYTVVKKRKVIV